MGFSELASSLIMFITVLSLTAGVVVAMKQQVDSTSHSMVAEQKRVSNELRTSINIDSVFYSSATSEVIIYVKNTGTSKLDISKIDVFVNNDWIPRSDSNRSIEILADTNTINPDFWDQTEIVKLVIQTTLSSGETHKLKIATEFGVGQEYEFSI